MLTSNVKHSSSKTASLFAKPFLECILRVTRRMTRLSVWNPIHLVISRAIANLQAANCRTQSPPWRTQSRLPSPTSRRLSRAEIPVYTNLWSAKMHSSQTVRDLSESMPTVSTICSISIMPNSFKGLKQYSPKSTWSLEYFRMSKETGISFFFNFSCWLNDSYKNSIDKHLGIQMHA